MCLMSLMDSAEISLQILWLLVQCFLVCIIKKASWEKKISRTKDREIGSDIKYTLLRNQRKARKGLRARLGTFD